MGSFALVALGLLLALQFLIQNEGVESKKHWPNGGGSKVMQHGWGGGLMQKVLYRQDKLRHWLQELQGATHYQEETVHRFDEELNTIQSELRKRKQQTNDKFNTIQSKLRKLERKVNKPRPRRVGDCDDGEVPTTDLATMQLGCCIPGFSLAQGKCCQPNFLVKDYVNTLPIGSGFTQSTNCCGTSNELTIANISFSVDGQCCEVPRMGVRVAGEPGDRGDGGFFTGVMAVKCCKEEDDEFLDEGFNCVPRQIIRLR